MSTKTIYQINLLINRGDISINPPIPPLEERHHRNAIYLHFVNPRKINRDHFTDQQLTIIKNNTGNIFDVIKIGFSSQGIEGCLKKIQTRSNYIMFGAIEYYILEVPNEMAYFFEQLSLVNCASSEEDDFGEYRICGKERGLQWFNLLQHRLNINLVTEENPQGMYLHPFNMYHGKIDTRCGATNTAQERPRELSLFYIIDIDTDILGLTQHNIQQLKSVPEFYTLFTMIHFGVSFRVDNFSGELNIARLGDYLQCLPVRQLRCSYVKVYNAIEIENHIKSCMSQQMMFNIEGEPQPFHTRECIHGVDKNTIVNRVENYIENNHPCRLPLNESVFIHHSLTRNHIPNVAVPSVLFVLGLSCGLMTKGEVTRSIQRVTLADINERILWENQQFLNADGVQQLRYISFREKLSELEIQCLESFHRYFGEYPDRLLNRTESNWTVLRERYNNDVDRPQIGLPFDQWTKQHVLLHHFTHYPNTTISINTT